MGTEPHKGLFRGEYIYYSKLENLVKSFNPSFSSDFCFGKFVVE